jgi:magnesium transporter
MSLDTRIADKQHIHTLTTRPGSQCGASAPTDAADDAATDPGSHHISIQLHAKRRRPGLDNILTPACVRASLSPRPADTTPAAGSKSHDACRAMSQATLAYGPVNEAEGRVARSNGVDGGVVDNAIYVDGVRTANPATLDETYERMRERHGMAWIGLYRPTPEEIRSVGTEFGLHHLVVDDAIAAHQRPKLERYGDILFTVLRPARYIDQREQVEFGELHVVTGDGFVVTIRYAESPDLASVRRRLESQPDLLRLGPEAVQRATKPLLDIINALVGGFDKYHVDIELHCNLRDVGDHVLRIVERIDAFRSLLQDALTVDATLVGQRQNDEIQRLTQTSLDQNEQVKRISACR